MKAANVPNPPPTGGRLVLVLAGAFCSFAPLGVLMQMVRVPPGTWSAGMVGVIVSGLIAIGWASVFIFRRFWLLVPLILAQASLPPVIFWSMSRLGVTAIGSGMPDQQRLLFHAVAAVIFIVAGYFLIIRYTELQEREATRSRTELELASQIHRTLVPGIDFASGRLRVVGTSIPSSQMGGDLIDLVIDGQRADVFLADVSGHGVKAGVVMAMVKAAIRMRLRSGHDLSGLLTDLDAVLQQTIDPGMFATFACMRFEPAESPGQLRTAFALAGHLPILHFSAVDGRVRDMPNEALPLGVGESELFHEQNMTSSAGDTFLLLTDGLTEIADASGKQLGLGAIRELFRAAGREPPEVIVDRLLTAARSHGAQNDDQTIVVVRVL
ncbi:MAG: serine/threonine-protein phosphatase [Phycisphaerales bacterium]|nr:serine/threonine-protein phosphatase [Phycisphaerales bacterium]